MKVIFAYYNDEDLGLTEYSDIIADKGEEGIQSENLLENKKEEEYRKYLITGIMEDFQYPELLEEFYEKLEKLESGEIKEVEWDGQAFQHRITRKKVEFTHTIFGICKEYPKWSCKYDSYKKILSGWKRFMEMPRNINSILEIEI